MTLLSSAHALLLLGPLLSGESAAFLARLASEVVRLSMVQNVNRGLASVVPPRRVSLLR